MLAYKELYIRVFLRVVRPRVSFLSRWSGAVKSKRGARDAHEYEQKNQQSSHNSQHYFFHQARAKKKIQFCFTVFCVLCAHKIYT
jgi:hypothetical protein